MSVSSVIGLPQNKRLKFEMLKNNYYSIKSYDHFCFFSQINNSKKKKDDFAFFVFFTFKGWKRLLLADAPRQVINGLTLYSFAKSVGFSSDISKWYDGSFAKASVLVSMAFTGTAHPTFDSKRFILNWPFPHRSYHLDRLFHPLNGCRLSVCSFAVLHSRELEGILLPQSR